MAGTWVTDLTPGGPYGLVGSPIQVLGLGLPPGQWDWSLSQGSVSRRHTGMPTLGCRHWDAMAGWDAQLREHRPHGAAAVPRWLKVCGLVSCVGWSQLWLGVKTTSRCQNHIYACVCPSCPSKRSRAKRDWRSSCAFLFFHARIAWEMRVSSGRCASIHTRQPIGSIGSIGSIL